MKSILVLNPSSTFCVLVIQSVRLSFLGVFTFAAPYLPWVMLTFSVLLGNPITVDVIGISVGHIYYFLEYVYPVIADIRGWKIKRITDPPRFVHMLCGSYRRDGFEHHLHQD